MKIPIEAKIPEDHYKRLEAIAKNMGLPMDAILNKAAKRGLPEIEEEVLGPQFAGKIVLRMPQDER